MIAERSEGALNWDDTNYETAFEPENQRGPGSIGTLHQGLPGASRARYDNPGSSNFHAAAPVLNLPGRGLDLVLNLTYNSRLWHKAGKRMYYDIDADWPAPGWSLGFGKLVATGQGSMLVDADGTRHPLTRQLKQETPGGNRVYIGHSRDGTFIDYELRESSGKPTWGQAKYPNGTIVEFTAPGSSAGALYPTRVVDANGNYITIAYRSNTGPQLETITDTLGVGRVVRFYYDANNLLTAITEPGLNGGTRDLVRLHYVSRKLEYEFSELVEDAIAPETVWLIDAIYYPGNSTGYWFGDPDSFSSYGMIAKVSEQRGMGFSAPSLNDQGAVTAGSMTRERVYNYPLKSDSTLKDAPAYTTMTETWEGMDTPPAVTTYLVHPDWRPQRNGIVVAVIYPDGTRIEQYSYTKPSNSWLNGLVYQEDISLAERLMKRTSYTWGSLGTSVTTTI